MCKFSVRVSYIVISLFVLVLVGIISCTNSDKGIGSQTNKATLTNNQKEAKIAKACYYIENSGSMFGYVNGYTEYVEVVNELATHPRLVLDNTEKQFFFVNGDNLQIKALGEKPTVLKDKLNVSEYRKGDIHNSNLNAMFQLALSKAAEDTISLLITDGIYDLRGNENPQTALANAGKSTRSKFLKRLKDENLQTLIVKINSAFDGTYYKADGRRVRINHNRPFYIWIFGRSELLSKYFTDTYIQEHLAGYKAMTRFFKPEDITVPYVPTTKKLNGSFKFDKKNKKILNDVKVDKFSGKLKFSIAVDFSEIPRSQAYLRNTSNYWLNNKYQLIAVEEAPDNLYAVNDFNPTHLLIVESESSPWGELTVAINYNLPEWISATDTNTEKNIQEDTTHTYGFRHLSQGITQAYQHISQGKEIAKMTIKLKK